ncbi:MAG: protein-export chaperone SecB [Gammaproteobacteria bacterium]|nr:protein-export chaperone SecB [Gammaproteobacteria bacterium]
MSDEKKPQFSIQRIYVKDVSFESPNSPSIFKDWAKAAPDLAVDLNTQHNHLEEEFWEASITIKATVKSNDQVAFMCEVQQAGIFTLQNIPEKEINQLLETIAIEAIYPFAREVISDLVTKAGFPQLLLAPINFDAFYKEKLKQQQK